LGQRIFEGWARNLSWAYEHAFVLVFCEFNWVPMMQYKVSTIDVLWNLKDVPQGLPLGLSNLVPFCPIWVNDASKSMEKEKIINNGLSKYMKFWKLGMCKDESYVGKLGPYVDY
jgi:hypothetical protein